MKSGNWIALDKNIINLLPHGRAYTIIEALISFTIDIDNKRQWTINGYSKQWGWSRNKVRKFTEELRTVKGHIADRKGTGKGHHICLKINNLDEVKDNKRTGKGQEEDRKRYTTINPNTKPNPKKEHIWILPEGINSIAWDEFEQHRKSMPKKDRLTDLARTKAANELFKLSEDHAIQQQIINKTITNGWKGLFPLNDNQSKGGRRGTNLGSKPSPEGKYAHLDK